jgi:hypothetical protein
MFGGWLLLGTADLLLPCLLTPLLPALGAAGACDALLPRLPGHAHGDRASLATRCSTKAG